MKKYKFLFLMLLLFLFQIMILSCNTTEPEDKKLALSFEDASCTEVWLNVTGETGKEIRLTRDGNDVKRFTLTSSPMTVFDDSLTVKTNYSYQAVRMDNGEKSSEVTAATLDTTNNNITWQTWILGDGNAGSSVLYDCAIISEDNIWAVGEIKKADSSENGYTTYNAAHWNGREWELKRVTVLLNGNSITPPLYGIFAFSKTEIWLSSGVPIRGDGDNWEQYHLFDMGILNQNDGYLTKIWGSASNDLYYVGTLGTIVHYQNGQWSKIETGTDLSFGDIYGTKNKNTGKDEILAVCTRNFPLRRGIYEIEGNTATQISNSPIQWELYSVWFIPERHYYVAGDGIYEKILLSNNSWKNEPLDITHYSTTGIRGNGLNDIFVSGAFGEMLHYNGVRWESFIGETGFEGAYGKVAVKDNLIAAVGSEGQLAKILIGKRNN